MARAPRMLLTGNAKPVTDSVKRGADYLAGRDPPKPMPSTRRNRPPKPAQKTTEQKADPDES
jgi:hypothetical protein